MWTPIDQHKVLREWAIAEATSSKEDFPKLLAQHVPQVLQKLRAGQRGALTEAELRDLERAIEHYRVPLLTELLRLQPQWYEGEIPVEILADMRIFNLPDWVRWAPSRKLSNFCGERTGEAAGRAEFKGFTAERPVAVGPSLQGPYCLVEGYTRCCGILRDFKAGIVHTAPESR